MQLYIVCSTLSIFHTKNIVTFYLIEIEKKLLARNFVAHLMMSAKITKSQEKNFFKLIVNKIKVFPKVDF